MEEDIEPPSLHDLLHSTALDRRIFPPDLVAPDAVAYLDHLISLPLTTLSKEPTLISAEAATVESELTNLCYREYPTFLSVHRCSAAVKSAFDDFQGSLDNLLDSVPVLEDECRLFAKRTQGLSAGRNRSILVQENQDKLLDLLELPQLMETCVRNGYYQEAMELANHAKDLQSRYNGNRLVTDVAKEVDSVNQLMLAQLFSLLREPVKLSTAMKTVSYLRRMDIMDEASLGLAFLSGRLYNFRTQLLQIEKDRAEPVRYLRRYIDAFREHVYDILSQHSAMFDDFDGLVSFAGQCVTDLVELVQSYIPRIAHDPASLSSVLIQLGYCSLSFARIGLDFAPLIAAPFADTVLSTYSHAVAAASDKLAGTLKAATNGQGTPTDALVDAEQRASVLASPPRFAAGADSPPHSLASFPPLAVFVNDNITALNALRLLAPTTLAAHLARALTQTLLADTGAVLAFLRDATQNVAAVNGDRPAHKRTPSSPRAQLLRRNTETQLSPAARAAKRHESRQISLIIAEVWLGMVQFLVGALEQEVLGGGIVELGPDLVARMEEVRAWIAANRVEEDEAVSAVQAEAPLAKGDSKRVGVLDDPFTVRSEGVRADAAESSVDATGGDIARPTGENGTATTAPAITAATTGSAAEALETVPTAEPLAKDAREDTAVENSVTGGARTGNASTDDTTQSTSLDTLTEPVETNDAETAAARDATSLNDGSPRSRKEILSLTDHDLVEPLFRAVPEATRENLVADVQGDAPVVPPLDLPVDGDVSKLASSESSNEPVSAGDGQMTGAEDVVADGKEAHDADRHTREETQQAGGLQTAVTGALSQEIERGETAEHTATSGLAAKTPGDAMAQQEDASGGGEATTDSAAGVAQVEDAVATTITEATNTAPAHLSHDATPDAATPEATSSPPQTPADGSEDEGGKESAPASKGSKKKKKKKKKS